MCDCLHTVGCVAFPEDGYYDGRYDPRYERRHDYDDRRYDYDGQRGNINSVNNG